MDKYTLDALNRIIEYIYDDEAESYEESDDKENHIFTHIQLVTDWVDKELGLNQTCLICGKPTDGISCCIPL